MSEQNNHADLSSVFINDMYESWFLDYASYVILERAVPAVEDGLKPVQRRILYAMKEMDDGRFNKVANIIGQSMQYNPHGDAGMGDVLVNKSKKVTDNTATEVEVLIDLAPGISPDITIDALYAFTDCEVSISPNACVIVDNKPRFLGVFELLKISVDKTVSLLKQELEIKLSELQDKWHYTSLEKIFFEEKIYKELEKKYDTWERVLDAIAKAFGPFRRQLKRDITREDVIKLTEKPVRRIYKLDIEELDAQIKGLEAEIRQVKFNLNSLVDFAVSYYENLLK